MAYLYKIVEIDTNKIYVGVRYKRSECDPNNFFKKYFTSSLYVLNEIKNHGLSTFKIVKIIEGEEKYIIELEYRYLRYMYNILGREKFKQRFINQNINGKAFILTDEQERLRIERSVAVLREKRMKGEIKYFRGKLNISDEERLRRKESMIGNTLGSLRKWTDEEREKHAKLAEGNKNVAGYSWWFNTETQQYKRSKEKPSGVFWVKKGLPNTETQRQAASLANKNKIYSEETIKKLSDAAKKRPSNAKGTIWVKNDLGQRKRCKPDNIPDGFKPIKNEGY